MKILEDLWAIYDKTYENTDPSILRELHKVIEALAVMEDEAKEVQNKMTKYLNQICFRYPDVSVRMEFVEDFFTKHFGGNNG